MVMSINTLVGEGNYLPVLACNPTHISAVSQVKMQAERFYWIDETTKPTKGKMLSAI